MCCNGVIFGDVELQHEDDAKRLAGLGLELFRKGRKKCFSQPCGCFDGKLCSIYEDRPNRCRSFECKLLKRVQSGQVSEAAALKSIAEARSAVHAVREIIRGLGDVDESVPLNRRYAAIIAQPIDLAGSKELIERRSELMFAVAELTRILGRDFLL